MILNEVKKDVAVAGNFKTSSFKIAASAKAFDILSSNIYTHKVRAVIRELSCNAHDAHIEAGNDQPFDVHLPTSLEPWFSVRDYGVGLSEQDVREIFTTYFCSTKTGSNDYIGALGLGSKSPFCLVDSFTVVSYFNNLKQSYSCYRDEDGEPQIALLTSESTSAPRGLEVIVNVDGRVSEFIEEATNVYQYFQSVPNINLNECKYDLEARRNSYIFDNGMIGIKSGWGSLKAVMGNVAYEIPSEMSHDIVGYVRFDLGELSFDPGRENLSLDTKTKETLTAKMEEVRSQLKDYLIKEIEKEPTIYTKAVKLESLRTGYTGRIISAHLSDFLKYKLEASKKEILCFSKTSYRKSSEKGYTNFLPFGDEVELFLYEPRYERRIRQGLAECGRRVVALLTQEQIDELKIDKEFIKDLNDEFPKAHNGRSYQTCKEKVFVLEDSVAGKSDRDCWIKNEIDLSNTNTERLYVEIKNWKPVDNMGLGYLIHVLRLAREEGIETPEIYGVKSAYTRTKKFQNSNWITAEDYLIREAKKIAPSGVVCYSGRKEFLLSKLVGQVEIEGFEEKWKAYKQQPSVDFYKKLDIELDMDNSLGIIERELMEKYPMLQFVETWDLSKPDKLNTVLNYIKGV